MQNQRVNRIILRLNHHFIGNRIESAVKWEYEVFIGIIPR
jgi:hypothetical protein